MTSAPPALSPSTMADFWAIAKKGLKVWGSAATTRSS
jgi:hypothetical protein